MHHPHLAGCECGAKFGPQNLPWPTLQREQVGRQGIVSLVHVHAAVVKVLEVLDEDIPEQVHVRYDDRRFSEEVQASHRTFPLQFVVGVLRHLSKGDLGTHSDHTAHWELGLDTWNTSI